MPRADGRFSMYARVSTIKMDAGDIDSSVRHFEEVTLPEARKLPGFEGATLLVGREKGVSESLTYQSSRQDLDASAEAATRLRTGLMNKAEGAELVSVEIFEVAVDVTGSED
jgi:hypothetical protein